MSESLIRRHNPNIIIPVSGYECMFDSISLFLIVGTWIFFSLNFFSLPNEIPSKFNERDQPI